MDRGAWWATVHGVTKSQTRLTNTFIFNFDKFEIWKCELSKFAFPFQCCFGYSVPWNSL